MWRDAETSPFHTEVGYWLWDPATGEVLRAFAVPRGVTVLAGGTATPDAVTFSLAADLGGTDYTISENQYLAERASSQSYRATDHRERGRDLELPPGHDAEDARASRALRTHRQEHPAPRALEPKSYKAIKLSISSQGHRELVAAAGVTGGGCGRTASLPLARARRGVRGSRRVRRWSGCRRRCSSRASWLSMGVDRRGGGR